jgi:hypothetical protein
VQFKHLADEFFGSRKAQDSPEIVRILGQKLTSNGQGQPVAEQGSVPFASTPFDGGDLLN